jgi:hypothetical protein
MSFAEHPALPEELQNRVAFANGEQYHVSEKDRHAVLRILRLLLG